MNTDFILYAMTFCLFWCSHSFRFVGTHQIDSCVLLTYINMYVFIFEHFSITDRPNFQDSYSRFFLYIHIFSPRNGPFSKEPRKLVAVFFCGVGMELRALHMLGQCPITELHSQPTLMPFIGECITIQTTDTRCVLWLIVNEVSFCLWLFSQHNKDIDICNYICTRQNIHFNMWSSVSIANWIILASCPYWSLAHYPSILTVRNTESVSNPVL